VTVALRTRLLVNYIGLSVLGILLASLVSSWQLKNYFDRRTEETLDADVDAICIVLRTATRDSLSSPRFAAQLRDIAAALDFRLTLIAPGGEVLYDSHVPPDSLPRMENHLHRPEIEGALRARFGAARRKSASVGDEFLYVATRLERGPDWFVRAAFRLDELRSLENQVQIIVWSVGLVILLVMAAVSVRLARRLTGPIGEIVTAARAIREGDLSQRIPVRGKDEIATLASAVNDMAQKLSADITQLRKLERMRREFLGNVSHELRTPIFSVQGFLETLLDGAMDDPSVNRDFLEKAHRHAVRLNALLNDLIEISRIESGDMKMSFRYIDPAAVVAECVEAARPTAAKKQIRLSVDNRLAPDTTVYADRDRLHQVLINLLDNAVKYTDDGGSVEVALHDEPPMTVIDVRDTGCGIEEEHLGRIFERFYRVDRDRSRAVGGTGLGLAIVKHIVEAHGGSISVKSVPGKGSTFSFSVKCG
jgi:two-component system, OmpR family, phosphate regulon sensor histidine kinase PhoR